MKRQNTIWSFITLHNLTCISIFRNVLKGKQIKDNVSANQDQKYLFYNLKNLGNAQSTK